MNLRVLALLSLSCLLMMADLSAQERQGVPKDPNVILGRVFLDENRNGLQDLRGIDPEIKPAIRGGISILRGFLEFAQVYDFRATPYGLCAGILKSPASAFSTAELLPLR